MRPIHSSRALETILAYRVCLLNASMHTLKIKRADMTKYIAGVLRHLAMLLKEHPRLSRRAGSEEFEGYQAAANRQISWVGQFTN